MVASVEEYIVLNKAEADNELIVGLSEIELRIDKIFKNYRLNAEYVVWLNLSRLLFKNLK